MTKKNYLKILKSHLGSSDIETYLRKKGYEINIFSYFFQSHPLESPYEMFTKTATKRGEIPSIENLFLAVFKKEIIKDLKWECPMNCVNIN